MSFASKILGFTAAAALAAGSFLPAAAAASEDPCETNFGLTGLGGVDLSQFAVGAKLHGENPKNGFEVGLDGFDLWVDINGKIWGYALVYAEREDVTDGEDCGGFTKRAECFSAWVPVRGRVGGRVRAVVYDKANAESEFKMQGKIRREEGGYAFHLHGEEVFSQAIDDPCDIFTLRRPGYDAEGWARAAGAGEGWFESRVRGIDWVRGEFLPINPLIPDAKMKKWSGDGRLLVHNPAMDEFFGADIELSVKFADPPKKEGKNRAKARLDRVQASSEYWHDDYIYDDYGRYAYRPECGEKRLRKATFRGIGISSFLSVPKDYYYFGPCDRGGE